MRSQKFYFNKVIGKFQEFLNPECINEQAKKSGFMQRKRKLDGYHFLLLCVGMIQGLKTSLSQMCTFLDRLNIQLTPESLNERFNSRAVRFMYQIFTSCLRLNIQGDSYQYLSNFKGIYIQDSTAFQLPDRFRKLFRGYGGGASSSAIKLDFKYDYQNSGWIDLKLCSGTDVDFHQLCSRYEPGSLILRDLGYFKIDDLQQITHDKAFYVSRLKGNITIHAHGGSHESIDLLKRSKWMKVDEIISMPVLLGSQKMPARLVVQKIPEKIADLIRIKLKTDKVNKRKGISKKRLNLCQIRAYVTNIPVEHLSAEQIMNLYHLRWQIEILFKSWKSLFKIHQVKEMKDERFVCMMLGCLIKILLNFKILCWAKTTIKRNDQIEISELKGIQSIETIANGWVQLFLKNTYYSLLRFLKNILAVLKKLCIKQPKNGGLTPTNLILT